jgi:predicted amidohydrolase
MHQISVAGPMFDLPTCLSKFLALGLSVRDVVAMATEGLARILRYENRGTLRVGASADIALFRLHKMCSHSTAIPRTRAAGDMPEGEARPQSVVKEGAQPIGTPSILYVAHIN